MDYKKFRELIPLKENCDKGYAINIINIIIKNKELLTFLPFDEFKLYVETSKCIEYINKNLDIKNYLNNLTIFTFNENITIKFIRFLKYHNFNFMKLDVRSLFKYIDKQIFEYLINNKLYKLEEPLTEYELHFSPFCKDVYISRTLLFYYYSSYKIFIKYFDYNIIKNIKGLNTIHTYVAYHEYNIDKLKVDLSKSNYVKELYKIQPNKYDFIYNEALLYSLEDILLLEESDKDYILNKCLLKLCCDYELLQDGDDFIDTINFLLNNIKKLDINNLEHYYFYNIITIDKIINEFGKSTLLNYSNIINECKDYNSINDILSGFNFLD